MINGHTILVGIIGMPVKHSLSPLIHNTAFEALGLNWCYVPLPVSPEKVEESIRGLIALGFQGVNVTAPHKQAVIPYLDYISPDAQQLGAVNTLIIKHEADKPVSVEGYNTDKAGFITDLRENGFEPKGKSVVIVGAGGAARAVISGLLSSGVNNISLLNRNRQRAITLIKDHQIEGNRISIATLDKETLVELSRKADLLINATPLGTFPEIQCTIWPEDVTIPSHLVVYDLVYNPLETKLLHQAHKANAKPIGGLGMLIHQAILSFELWTGQLPPLDILKSKAEEFLTN
jgi:shikimate dehydrogenase